MGVLDEKIEQLRAESDDIRQRASLVLQTMPEAPEGAEPESTKVAELQEIVHQREQQVQLLKREEERLQEEQAEAKQELEAAKVEAAVLEKRNEAAEGQDYASAVLS